jgi:processive 1,2-diacylglycerol beta-glucosyltransferase
LTALSRGSDGGVLLVSASMGAGHDGVAQELARRLREQGTSAEVVDYLALLPFGTGRLYRALYHFQLRHAPVTYEWLYRAMDGHWPVAQLTRLLGQLGRWRLRRWLRAGNYRLVLSTYPMASQAIGLMRQRGHLLVPAVTFLTDADVHTMWLHKSVDLHVAVWPISAAEAARRVGGQPVTVGPVVPPRFWARVTDAERAAARARLGLRDPGGPVVIITAGSWGVGDLIGTARAIAESGVATPLVLCGRNEALRRELEAQGIGIVVGWTADVRGVLAAGDALVHNAGGLSCLEGFAVGIPVIGFACLPGHGRRNAAAMRDAGVAALADNIAELVEELRRLARTHAGAAMASRARELFVADPTPRLLQLARSVALPVRPRAARLPAAARCAVTACAVLALSWAGLSLGVAEATERGFGVAHGRSAVYIAAEADPSVLGDPSVAEALRRHGVSVALQPTRSLTDARADTTLAGDGVSVVGAAAGSGTCPASHQVDAADVSEDVAAMTHEKRPPVIFLHHITPCDAVVAWTHRLRLAVAGVRVAPGAAVPTLRPGTLLLLDLRGRTPTQLAADLDVMSARLSAAGLPSLPMRRLWRP